MQFDSPFFNLVYKVFKCVLVNVKWGKERFEGVQLSTDEPPIGFKMQLFSLTSVAPERQKVRFLSVPSRTGILPGSNVHCSNSIY